MKMICHICGKYIDPKYGFVYYRKEKKTGLYQKEKSMST